jgi:hypothetical protein
MLLKSVLPYKLRITCKAPLLHTPDIIRFYRGGGVFNCFSISYKLPLAIFHAYSNPVSVLFRVSEEISPLDAALK